MKWKYIERLEFYIIIWYNAYTVKRRREQRWEVGNLYQSKTYLMVWK